MRSALRQMVSKVTRHSALQRELMEEILSYLAKIEAAAPDREMDWYLKRCSRQLAHFRYLARSWESPKLPQALVEKAATSLRKNNTKETRRFSEVVAVLGKQLSKREKKILEALTDGHSPEEIAAGLKEQLPFVVRAQRKIAVLILKQGLVPRPERPRKKGRAKTPGGKVEPSRASPAGAEPSAVMMPVISARSDPPAPRVSPT
jgi:hypothetical protein